MIEALCRHIDGVNARVGRAISFLFIALTIIVVMEVVLRYCFNSPTIWAWDINIQIAAFVIALGAGYALLHHDHVIVDVIVGHFPPRVRAIIDMLTALIFFFGVGMLLYLAIGEAKISIVTGEKLTSLLEPPLGPIRALIAFGILLLLLQGLAKFIRDLMIALGKGREETA